MWNRRTNGTGQNRQRPRQPETARPSNRARRLTGRPIATCRNRRARASQMKRRRSHRHQNAPGSMNRPRLRNAQGRRFPLPHMMWNALRGRWSIPDPKMRDPTTDPTRRVRRNDRQPRPSNHRPSAHRTRRRTGPGPRKQATQTDRQPHRARANRPKRTPNPWPPPPCAPGKAGSRRGPFWLPGMKGW